MLFQIKTLLVVLVLSQVAFWVARRAIPEEIVASSEFKDIKIAWVLITLAAFLSMNFMLFAFITVIVLIWVRRKVDPVFAFLGLLLAVPCFEATISGFGPINTLLSLNYPRLLSWCLLLPLMFTAGNPSGWRFGAYFSDYIVVLLGVLFFVLQIQVDSLTSTLRSAVYFGTEVYLPYWAMSRYAGDAAKLMKILCGMIIAAASISLMAVFEFGKGWLLYDRIDETLGVFLVDGFLVRGGLGWLRASVSAGHSLVLGYVMAVAIILTLSLYLKPATMGKDFRNWMILLGCLLAGLFATLARGMWVGCLFGVFVWCFLSPMPVKTVLRLTVGVFLVGMLASLTPAGQSVINSLPFIGEAEQDNVEYRQKLFTISMMVIKENLWLGSQNFMAHPLMQLLIQGEGIIDLVNSYIGYALSSGVVGVALFTASFLSGLLPLGLRVMKLREVDSPLVCAARALCAALAAIMLMIATASSLYVIPVIYWAMIGLAVKCAALLKEADPALVTRA